MHLDPLVSLAGLVVGFTVGLTGMGGGALMTPILVLLFNVQPLAAVSSDLVASMVMKPVGGAVHLRRGTVNRALVRWLVLGSVPAAFTGVLILKALGDSQTIQDRLELMLGITLLVAATSMAVKSVVQARRTRRILEAELRYSTRSVFPPFRVRPGRTILIGAVGGLVVGITSVGSGSLIIIALIFLYPTLAMKELVGTDLVQAVPLVGGAALGHILFGDFQMSLTTSLLIGSIPGVYLGARVSSRAPDGLVRPALVVVLVASALKLLGLSTEATGLALLGFVFIALPAWGIIDILSRPDHHWAIARASRMRWVLLQAVGAPVGVGVGAAVAYFIRVRPRLRAAEAMAAVSVFGDEMFA